jgi:L-methionine (R)-S-oxide reductase
MNIPQLKESITAIAESNQSVSEKRQEICDYLKQEIDYYHWVGFYFKNGDKEELKLAEFAGEPTEHTVIPFGKGICGQVAISNKNFVVPDVTAQDNYISCGFKVKSEIVIPVFVNGENVGQIDIDSHITNPFSEADELFLEFVCKKVAQLK